MTRFDLIFKHNATYLNKVVLGAKPRYFLHIKTISMYTTQQCDIYYTLNAYDHRQ